MSHVVFNDPYNKCPGSKIITDLAKHTYKRKKIINSFFIYLNMCFEFWLKNRHTFLKFHVHSLMKDAQLGIIETSYNVATGDPDNIIVLVLPAIIQQNSIIVKEQISMNRKYHNYRLQTKPRQHEEEKHF